MGIKLASHVPLSCLHSFPHASDVPWTRKSGLQTGESTIDVTCLPGSCELRKPPALQIRVVDEDGGKGENSSEDDQEFLKKIEQTMLSQVVLQGVAGVRKVFLRDAKSTNPDPSASGDGYRDQNEWVLDTEGTNLLEVCIPCLVYPPPVPTCAGFAGT